VRWLELDIH